MSTVKYLNARQIKELLPWPELINAIDEIFVKNVVEPVRHHHSINVPDDPQATLLLMPVWIEGEYLGVKQVAVFPGNSLRGKPGLNGSYLLSSAKTGEPLVQFDADELTARRTAAASALASRYLSRTDSHNLLMIGSGRLARALVDAHCAVRPIDTIEVWSRNQQSAEKLVETLIVEGRSATVCTDEGLANSASSVDIISCATMSNQPIILGEWLQAGTHLDLVGAFRPDMRETDDAVIQKSSVFVDTRAGALVEAGDLTQAMQTGAFSADDVVAEFTELCANKHQGRDQLKDSEQQITLFKSVGAAREDLAAAMLSYKSLTKDQ